MGREDKQEAAEQGFDGYEETTLDPGPWLLLTTIVFCFGMMLVVVPLAVHYTVQSRRRTNAKLNDDDENKDQDHITLREIWSWDKETRKILRLAVPYSVSAVFSSTFSNACLILISQNIGVKSVAAYALVQVLAGLTDGILQGPIYACTTVCSQAIGAGNNVLAGNYIQLSLIMYGLLYVPVIWFWWYYMYEVILYLQWGDDVTAGLAQDFIRVNIFSYILGGISTSVWQLLEITNHAVAGTVVSIVWGMTNAIAVGILCVMPNPSLVAVAHIYNGTALFYIGLTLAMAQYNGWLKPFWSGLIGTFAARNASTVRLLLKQAIPLAMGSLLSNAEWAVLAFFASHLGPAEVAAWALLGSLWEVFYSSTAGIGDAAEIRLAYHLGNNDPKEAQRCAYKSLSLGMLVATVISIAYFSLQRNVPAWFTTDSTIQAMLRELVPFVGVANLTMTFGMQCWSLVGAQGKYKMATWINFISSWGVVMPMAAIFVFVVGFDLQGLTAAACVGYLSTGSALSYVLLSTDWNKVAKKIHYQSCDESTVGDSDSDFDDSDDDDIHLYAALRHRSEAARRTARANIRLLVIPAGHRSGLMLGNTKRRQGTYVVRVRDWSP